MKASHGAWQISHAYLLDNMTQDFLPTATYNTLLGWIRSRSLDKCCTASSLFDVALHNVNLYPFLRQFEAFFKKCKNFRNANAETVAFAGFLASQRKCRITNKRLAHYNKYPYRLDDDLAMQVAYMRSFIKGVLGRFEPFMEKIPELVRVSTGATSTRKRSESYAHKKFVLRAECTRRCAPYVRALGSKWGVRVNRFRLTKSNRIAFVPKNYKTDRTIACEPTHNVPFQLAFDSYCKGRLRKYGVNLSDQSLNQLAAFKGSLDGSLATLDLKSASDSLSLELVNTLFPPQWSQFLSDLRCCMWEAKVGCEELEGIYSNFSSMGNGTTFPIETLVFLAAARAAGDESPVIYGDDIICKTEIVGSLVKLLSFLGFAINDSKSFWDPSFLFRESCGTDWLKGRNVTPFYIRDLHDLDVWNRLCVDRKQRAKARSQLSHVVNGLVRIAEPHGYLWKLCLTLKRANDLLFVPESADTNSGVFVSIETLRAIQKVVCTQSCYKFRSYVTYDPKGQSVSQQALFLWYFRYGQDLGEVNTERVVSRYSLYTPCYKEGTTKLLYQELTDVSDHVLLWSEYVLRAR